jgi:hypothetical protein
MLSVIVSEQQLQDRHCLEGEKKLLLIQTPAKHAFPIFEKCYLHSETQNKKYMKFDEYLFFPISILQVI